MPESTADSLGSRLAALHAERERTWEPEKLARNIAQRTALVDAFDPSGIARVGETIEPFTLYDADGSSVPIDDLVANGPAVLVFFRFAACPACNIALPYYDRQLHPALAAADVPLVGVSPHLPEQGLDEIRQRHGLGFAVLNDRDNALGRRLGITFARGEVPEGQPSPGWIGELTGTGTAELPQATVLILDRGRIVRFIDVSPDWLVRTEAPAIIDAIHRLQDVQAAA